MLTRVRHWLANWRLYAAVAVVLLLTSVFLSLVVFARTDAIRDEQVSSNTDRIRELERDIALAERAQCVDDLESEQEVAQGNAVLLLFRGDAGFGDPTPNEIAKAYADYLTAKERLADSARLCPLEGT